MRTQRADWCSLPARLRRDVGDLLGGDVATFTPADGGFSVGGVVGVASSGPDRVFVKAVPTDHPAATDYRIEARVAAALPPEVPTPPLRLAADVGGWVLLAFDAVDGRPATEPWTDDDLTAALAVLTRTADALAAVPGLDVPTVAERMAGRCETWRALERTGRCGPLDVGDLGPWERANLRRLAALEDTWPGRVVADSLVHFDLRHDNVLVTADGAVVVDWGRACRGPAWVDLACLLLESDLGGRDPERLFAGHPLGQDADPDDVDPFLVALAGYWTHAAALPPPPGAAHLRARQEQSRLLTVGWLRTRWS